MSDKYGNTGMPTRKNTDFSKQKTNDLYRKDGQVCGDLQATGTKGKTSGSGPSVGGYPMGVHNTFANGVPDEGRENITAEVMSPTHKANVTDSVLNTKEDKTWGGVIAPQNMASNTKIGI